MDIYENISELIKEKPDLVDDITQLYYSKVDVKSIDKYSLINYFKDREKSRMDFQLVDSIRMIKLAEWIYNEGVENGKSINFSKFLEDIVYDKYSSNYELDQDIIDELDMWYCTSLDFEDIAKKDATEIIKRICQCNMNEVIEYINKD